MVVTTALPRAALGGMEGRPSPALSDAEAYSFAGDWVGQGGWLADGALGSGSARRPASPVLAGGHPKHARLPASRRMFP